MNSLRVTNTTRGALLGDRIRKADRWWPRFVGLLGTRTLDPGEGLLISPCRAVHTYGMRYTIDVAFLDSEHRVVARYGWLRRGRRSKVHREATYALELRAGELDRTGTQVGDQLEIEAASEERDEQYHPPADLKAS
jgi:uncharacterized protein